MKLIRIAAPLIVTAAVVTAAALASGSAPAVTSQPLTAADSAVDAEVQVVAIATAIISSAPIASGELELDPNDELLRVVHLDDLPPQLRSGASTHSFSSPLYEEVDGNIDGVVLLATNFSALLGWEDSVQQERRIEVQELRIGPPPPARPVTTTVHVMVMRFPSEESVERIYGQDAGHQEGEVRVALRGIDEGSEFDFDEAVRDTERTYNERYRETISPAGLGEHAYGETIAVAVLDYDRVANRYRSDDILSWQYSETLTFTTGRYAVSVARSAVSPTDSLASDVDITLIATAIADRLSARIVP